MALTNAVRSTPASITRNRSTLVCQCSSGSSRVARPRTSSKSSSSSSSSSSSACVVTTLAQQLASAALTASLLLAPVGAAEAAKPQQLADLLRAEYDFLDANEDGIVSRSDLQQFVKATSSEENLPLVPEDQIDFTLRLYDLNQDGNTTNEEVLRAMVLDGAVDEDAVDADVFDIVDKNRNGTIEADEFTAGLGDLGQDGDQMKQWIFHRVDHVTSSNGQLSVGAFGNALVLVRNVLLGY